MRSRPGPRTGSPSTSTRPMSGIVEARDEGEHRALAAAARPHEADELALRDGEVDVVERVDLDRARCGTSSSRPRARSSPVRRRSVRRASRGLHEAARDRPRGADRSARARLARTTRSRRSSAVVCQRKPRPRTLEHRRLQVGPGLLAELLAWIRFFASSGFAASHVVSASCAATNASHVVAALLRGSGRSTTRTVVSASGLVDAAPCLPASSSSRETQGSTVQTPSMSPFAKRSRWAAFAIGMTVTSPPVSRDPQPARGQPGARGDVLRVAELRGRELSAPEVCRPADRPVRLDDERGSAARRPGDDAHLRSPRAQVRVERRARARRSRGRERPRASPAWRSGPRGRRTTRSSSRRRGAPRTSPSPRASWRGPTRPCACVRFGKWPMRTTPGTSARGSPQPVAAAPTSRAETSSVARRGGIGAERSRRRGNRQRGSGKMGA